MPNFPTRLLLAFCLLFVSACSNAGLKKDDGGQGDSANADSSANDSAKSQSWSGKSLDDWSIVFDEMQEALDLAADEEQQLQKTFEQHVDKLQAWYREHGPRVAEGDRAVIQAAKDRDLARLREIKDEIVPLKQEAMALHKAMDSAVLDALNDANRFRWQGHRLAARFFGLAEPLKLSSPQRKQVGELATEAAKSVRTHSTPQAAGFLEMEKVIEAKVLNADQRKEYDKIKNDNKLRSLKTYSSFQPTKRKDKS